MEEQTEVIELEGKPLTRWTPWKRKRVEARANLLYMYLSLFEGQDKRFSQPELSEVLTLGKNQQPLKEAVGVLEQRGWVKVDRSKKPHRYELLKNDTEETAE
ncbi:hypothetical protein [Streptomyces sp. ATCC 21386]|uniref:hypothetical protein n=1 Tax=Streptomyces sp. ATCC 21386 TaxID=2699428 RepID=UPI001BFF0DD7|nr:hypothetical protein [Streptomyces sp. ATCC 21386]